MTTQSDLLTRLAPLLKAECAAEAHSAGLDAADLEQSVWVRLLSERRAGEPVARLAAAVRAEVQAALRRARREVLYDPTAEAAPAPGRRTAPGAQGSYGADGVEQAVLAAESRRELRAAIRRLPGRCPRLISALLSGHDPTYREIAGKLGMSQGSLGPVRSRCLGCLRRMLMAEIAAP